MLHPAMQPTLTQPNQIAGPKRAMSIHIPAMKAQRMTSTRRSFFGWLAVAVIATATSTVTVDAEAKGRGGRRSGGGSRAGKGSGKSGGGSRGCGSRGGPGYRKPNGQCAGWKD